MIIDTTQSKIERELEPFNEFKELAKLISQDSDGFKSMIEFMEASMRNPVLTAEQNNDKSSSLSF